MPTNVALFPQAVERRRMPAIKEFGDFEAAGTLGSAYSPFVPSGGGELRRALKLDLPLDRLDDRRQLLTGLDRIHRSLEADALLADGRQPPRSGPSTRSSAASPTRSTSRRKTRATDRPLRHRPAGAGPRSTRRGTITRTTPTTSNRSAS